MSVLLRERHDYSPIEESSRERDEFPSRPVPVNELVEHLAGALDFLDDDGIAVHLRLGCDRWSSVATDRALIEGLLLGLCLRGRDHMPQGGLLSFETLKVSIDGELSETYRLPPGEYARIGVIDTGGWSNAAGCAWMACVGSSRRLVRPSLAALRHAAESGGGTLVCSRCDDSGGRADLYLPVVNSRPRAELALA